MDETVSPEFGALSGALDALDEGFAIFDPEFRLVYANGRFAELRGYPVGLCTPGVAMRDLLLHNAGAGDYGPGDAAAQVDERIAQISGKIDRRVEIKTAEGRDLHVHYRRLEDGRLLVKFLDVSAERQAQADLKQSEARHALAMEALAEGVYDWDIVKNELFVSAQLNRMFDFAEGELRSEDWVERLHPDDIEPYKKNLVMHFKGHQGVLECEYRIRDKSGSYRWMQDRGIARRNEDGRAVRLIGAVTDITEDKNNQLALADANEAREAILSVFNTLLETVDYGIMFLDKDLKARFANRSFREMWGLPEELIATGPSFPELMEYNRERLLSEHQGEDWPAYVEERTELVRRGQPEPVEVELADGRILSYQVILLPDGGRMQTYFDITRFKHLENEIRASQQRYERAMEAIGEGVYDLNLAENTIYYSPAVYRMSGLSAEQLKVPEDWFNLIHPDDLPHYQETIQAHFKGESERFSCEYRYRRSDGTWNWARQHGLAQFDDAGRAVRMVGSTGDITREKEATDALAAAQNRLHDAIENISEGFALFDADDCIVMTNSVFQNFFHQLADIAVPGQDFRTLVKTGFERGMYPYAGDDFESWFADMQVHRAKPIETREVHINDRWLQVSERRTGDGGLVAVYTDISGLKESAAALATAKEQAEAALEDLTVAQDKLVHAEKMASLGQLTAGIAHEIKNPLNFVTNFADLSVELMEELNELIAPLLPQLAADDREDADDCLETLVGNLAKIKQHGLRADSIVKSMLLHSRGKSDEFHPTDLNELVEESLALAYHGARAQNRDFNITLEKDYDDAVGTLNLVPQEITRVLINLVSNGFYAANKRAGEETDGYEPCLKVTTRADGDEIHILIRDNGTGMSEAVQADIFSPFFTTKPPGEGTGLGLSLSYDVVAKLHGGDIGVASREGDFTEFDVMLPQAAG